MKNVSRPIIAAIGAGIFAFAVAFGFSAILKSGSPRTSTANQKPADVPGTMDYIMKVVSTATDAQIERGKPIFAANCASCHGDNGQGAYGPDLRNTDLSAFKIAAKVMNGSKKMPPFMGVLSNDNIADVTVYARSLKK